MISSHTGAAPLTPETSHIGVPEKFPTHTPTVYRFEYPTHQLSRMSLLVPVLTAVQKRVASGLSRLKVALRASRSDKISEMMKEASRDITRRGAGSSWSGERRRALQDPLFARARYAFTSSQRLMSAVPRASDGP